MTINFVYSFLLLDRNSYFHVDILLVLSFKSLSLPLSKKINLLHFLIGFIVVLLKIMSLIYLGFTHVYGAN